MAWVLGGIGACLMVLAFTQREPGASMDWDAGEGYAGSLTGRGKLMFYGGLVLAAAALFWR